MTEQQNRRAVPIVALDTGSAEEALALVRRLGDACRFYKVGGELFTPPVECGLLPGVFRKHLLARGEIKERVITIEEFKRAKEFYLINSVRKWIRVHLLIRG